MAKTCVWCFPYAFDYEAPYSANQLQIEWNFNYKYCVCRKYLGISSPDSLTTTGVKYISNGRLFFLSQGQIEKAQHTVEASHSKIHNSQHIQYQTRIVPYNHNYCK